MPDDRPIVLCLGASVDQLFLIRTAKAKNLRTLAVDMNPNSPGFAEATFHETVSTRDLDQLKAMCDRYNNAGNPISGVLVMGSDIPDIVAGVAEHLGTQSVTKETARLTTNKFEMKQHLKKAGVAVPWFDMIDSAADLKTIAAERGLPLIIKPIDRSGARGVFYIDASSPLDQLFALAKDQSFAGQVMVEEYLPGLQISSESVIWDGICATPGFVDRNYEHLERFKPYIIENGGSSPSTLTTEWRERTEALIADCAAALGITRGIAKGDIVITDKGPYIIEMAARLSGGDFSESLISLGVGVNIVSAAIDIALGNKPDFDALLPKTNRFVANRYFFPKPGKLLSVNGLEQVRDLDYVHKLETWYKVGDQVPAVTSHAERFGVFVVTADSRNELLDRIHHVYETIKIETES